MPTSATQEVHVVFPAHSDRGVSVHGERVCLRTIVDDDGSGSRADDWSAQDEASVATRRRPAGDAQRLGNRPTFGSVIEIRQTGRSGLAGVFSKTISSVTLSIARLAGCFATGQEFT